MKNKRLLSFINKLPLLLAAIIPFLLTFTNSVDRDMWYHIKLGEYMVTHLHLLHTDVFAYSTGSRPSYPTEWLFQILLYTYQHIFGLGALGIFVGLTTSIEILLLFMLIRHLTNVNPWANLMICSLYFARIGNTMSPRPFGLANILLLVWVGIILLYVKTRKTKLLFLFPLLMYLWSNFHGSFIVGCLILSAFAVTYTLYGFFSKNNLLKKQGLFMGLAAAGSWLVTIFPPLFFDQYKVLLLYVKFHQNALYIIEWNPLPPVDAAIYAATILTLVTATFLLYKKRLQDVVILIPFLPLLILPFDSQRHIIVAFLPVALLLGFTLKKLLEKRALFLMAILLLALLGEGIYYFSMYQTIHLGASQEPYPAQAAQFIKNYHVQGNMLNSYNFGGYLLYHLYPYQKVFVDGWADPYLCCEITYLEKMARAPSPAEQQIRLEKLLHDYAISFVVVTRTPLEVDMNALMSKEKDFTLIYWDDNTQIYVKNDGKNTILLNALMPHFASPFGTTQFDRNHLQEALNEYQRMASISDSAKSRNAIGMIDIALKDVPDAIKQFTRAIQVNNLFLPPYINLGEIYIQQKRYDNAIYILQQAVLNKPNDPYVYIRLAQLYMSTQNTEKAKEILQEGINNTSDTDALTKLLQTIQNQ